MWFMWLYWLQSYDEIIDLAEKGNMFNVTTSQRQFQKESVGEPGETPEEGAGGYFHMNCFTMIKVHEIAKSKKYIYKT